jgi:hypothetical protein
LLEERANREKKCRWKAPRKRRNDGTINTYSPILVSLHFSDKSSRNICKRIEEGSSEQREGEESRQKRWHEARTCHLARLNIENYEIRELLSDLALAFDDMHISVCCWSPNNGLPIQKKKEEEHDDDKRMDWMRFLPFIFSEWMDTSLLFIFTL